MAEAPLSSLAVYSARPTIRADEQEHQKLSELLIGMEMKEQEGGMSSIELRFSNVASDTEGSSSLAFEDERILKLGTNLRVYGGDENEPQEIFSGIVTGLEADFPDTNPPELVVLAEDILQKSRMARKTQLHEDVSLAEVAQSIANNLGLTTNITELTDPIGTWQQFNESDLVFLRRMLKRYDADMQIIGRELHVYPRSEMQRQLIELELHGQLKKATFLADLAHQVSQVSFTGWDINQGEKISVHSTGANPGPGNGRSGRDILIEALGERSEHIGHLTVNDEREAQSLVDSAFDQRSRSFVCVNGTAEGNSALRVGSHVRLTGVSNRLNNVYYVTSTRHRYDVSEGYETDFEAESATLGNA